MTRFALPSLLAAVLLSGCLGSVVAYRPGFEPRPEQESVEAEEEAVIRLAVPAEIERSQWHMNEGRREVGRIFAELPKNSWNKYEEDVLVVLEDEHAKPVLKDRYTPTKIRLTPKALGPSIPTKKDEEGGGEKPAAAEEGGGE